MTDVNYPDDPPADAAVPADDTSLVEVPADTKLSKEEASQGGPAVDAKQTADVTGADLDAHTAADQPVEEPTTDVPETELQPGEVLITRDNPRPGPGVRTVMYDDELPAAGPGQGHVLPNGLLAGSETVVEGGFQAPDRVIPRPEDVPHPDETPAANEPADTSAAASPETAPEASTPAPGAIPGEPAAPEAPTASEPSTVQFEGTATTEPA